MYCDLSERKIHSIILWPLDFQIQKRIVFVETIWGNTVLKKVWWIQNNKLLSKCGFKEIIFMVYLKHYKRCHFTSEWRQEAWKELSQTTKSREKSYFIGGPLIVLNCLSLWILLFARVHLKHYKRCHFSTEWRQEARKELSQTTKSRERGNLQQSKGPQ